MTSRNYCITLFNVFDIKEFKLVEPLKYVVLGLEECPKTHKKHIHGYVELTKPIRMEGLKKLFNDETIHVEKRKGTALQAIDYVKKDGNYAEFGKHTGQGFRSDLDEVGQDLKSGIPLKRVIEDHTATYIRYHKGIEKVRGHYLKESTKNFRQVFVSVFWGASGTGKTRKAFQEFKDDYFKLDCANNVWFDGYDGEPNLLIDDFYGWIKFGHLLNILDGHPLRVEVKGGFTYANWTRVIITSNKDFSLWYKDLTDNQFTALKRRIKECIEFK